jgi:hypothetical protein
MKKTLLLFIGFCLALFSNAQTTITGTVVDSGNGEALVGVNVIIKGTTTGKNRTVYYSFHLSGIFPKK